jgi:RNA polymerase sigma-B factor
MQTRLRDAIETLGADLRRAPTPAELARYLDVAEDVVLDALDAAAANRTSSIDEHGRTDGGLPIASTLVAQDQSADEIVLVRDLLARLPARERRIVEMRFFMGSNQQEIAQHLRISQVHVSRLLRSALLTLRRTLTDETQT